MYIFVTVLAVMAAIILTILVLAQNSKGGGLAAGFSSSNQIMGVRKTTDFVEKATWGFASFIIVMAVIATFAMSTPTTKESAVASEAKKFQVDPNLVNPNAPQQQQTQE